MGMTSVSTRGIEIEPISPLMGAVVRGVALSDPVDEPTFAAIRVAFVKHTLLRFHGQQHLTAAQLIAFSRRFGELQIHVLDQYRHKQYPEIYRLSNVDESTGRTTGRHPDRGTLVWHSDLSFQRRPAQATILHALDVPRRGGDTLYANMQAAYDALPDAMKARIAGLRGVHDLDYSRQRAGEPPMTEQQRRNAPPVDHPLARRHSESGRACLYLSHHVSRIVGLGDDEGRALFEQLMAHATSDRFVFRNSWRSGDVVMWDNRCTMHRATEYDAAHERRVIHRCVVLGDIPNAA